MVCKYCGEAISKKEIMCPKCNRPTQKGVWIVVIGLVIITLVFVMIVGVIPYYRERQREKENVELIKNSNLDDVMNEGIENMDKTSKWIEEELQKKEEN